MTQGRSWHGVRVCVTGATGFVGFNLCRDLAAAGAEVHAVARSGGPGERHTQLIKQGRLHTLDLRDEAAVAACLSDARPSVVFHAAVHNAYRADDPLPEIVGDNVLAVAALIAAIRSLKAPPRLVHLASSTEYGPSNRPHREEHPLQPTTVHGATKAASTLLVLQQARAGLVDAVGLRLFSVYGPWEGEHRLVPSAIRAALDDTALPLTPAGFRRDYVYVGDVVEACLRAAEVREAAGHVINIGSGLQTANEELVQAVALAAGRPVRTIAGAYAPHRFDTSCWVADVERARTLLGWTPRHSLSDGLARTVAWVRHRRAESR